MARPSHGNLGDISPFIQSPVTTLLAKSFIKKKNHNMLITGTTTKPVSQSIFCQQRSHITWVETTVNEIEPFSLWPVQPNASMTKSKNWPSDQIPPWWYGHPAKGGYAATQVHSTMQCIMYHWKNDVCWHNTVVWTGSKEQLQATHFK